MSLQVEKLEKNMAKLTIEVSAEEFEKAVQAAYLKNKGRITLPGFRKGKAPRAMIEKMYGTGVFYEEAINIAFPKYYEEVLDKEPSIEAVARPDIDIKDISEKANPETVKNLCDYYIEDYSEIYKYFE